MGVQQFELMNQRMSEKCTSLICFPLAVEVDAVGIGVFEGYDFKESHGIMKEDYKFSLIYLFLSCMPQSLL